MKYSVRFGLLWLVALLPYSASLQAQPVNVTANSSAFATDPGVSVNGAHWWITWLEYDPQLNADAVHSVHFERSQEVGRFRVDSGDAQYLSPQVAAKSDGGAWFVWVEVAAEGAQVLARQRTPGGWSGPPISVSDSLATGAFPSLALTANDAPCIAWEQSAAWGREISAACWDGNGFSALASPSTADNAAYEPTLTADSAGGIWAVWQERKDSNYEIMARRLVEGSWGAPVQVTQPTQSATGGALGMHVLPRVTAGANGQVWITWVSKGLHNRVSSGWVIDRRIQLRLVTPTGAMSNIQQVPLHVGEHHPNVAQQDGGADAPSIEIMNNQLFVFYRRLINNRFRWDLRAQVSQLWSNQWLDAPLEVKAASPNRAAGYPSAAALATTGSGVLAVWQADDRPDGYDPAVINQPASDVFFDLVPAQASTAFTRTGDPLHHYATSVPYDDIRPTTARPHLGMPMKLFQGDLHAHTVMSHDGQGGNDFMRENIRRAHDNARLHFYTMTDHAFHASPADWHTQQKIHSVYAKLGDLQMLLGFEHTNFNDDLQGRNYGHQNVILRGTR